MRPIGTISRYQLDVLATAPMAAVHAISDRYDEGRSVVAIVAASRRTGRERIPPEDGGLEAEGVDRPEGGERPAQHSAKESITPAL